MTFRMYPCMKCRCFKPHLFRFLPVVSCLLCPWYTPSGFSIGTSGAAVCILAGVRATAIAAAVAAAAVAASQERLVHEGDAAVVR